MQLEDFPFDLHNKTVSDLNENSHEYLDTEIIEFRDHLILKNETSVYRVDKTDFGYIFIQYKEES